MAGAIIENMSTKKLVIVGVILLLFQAFSFMVGGLIGKRGFPNCILFCCNLCLCYPTSAVEYPVFVEYIEYSM